MLERFVVAQRKNQKWQAGYWIQQVVVKIPFEVQPDALDWVEYMKSHASLVLPPVSVQ
jgi:hypothetical protein